MTDLNARAERWRMCGAAGQAETLSTIVLFCMSGITPP